MKKLLNIFALVVAILGVAVAISIVVNAPPAEERVEGAVFISNAVERSAAMLKAWTIAITGVAGGLFFGALGAIVDRLEAIHAALVQK